MAWAAPEGRWVVLRTAAVHPVEMHLTVMRLMEMHLEVKNRKEVEYQAKHPQQFFGEMVMRQAAMLQCSLQVLVAMM